MIIIDYQSTCICIEVGRMIVPVSPKICRCKVIPPNHFDTQNFDMVCLEFPHESSIKWIRTLDLSVEMPDLVA